MPKLWSETPGPRAREIAADAATLLWLGWWIEVGRRLHAWLAATAAAGRALRAGGHNLEAAGVQMGDALGVVPGVGGAVGETVRVTIAAAAAPLIDAGTDLERALLVLAAVISLVVVAVPLILWLRRYLPWRLARIARLRAADRAVRRAPQVPAEEIERVLAARAIHRLPFQYLLRYSPDPLGDWITGRYDRLARAELATAGLAPRQSRRT